MLLVKSSIVRRIWYQIGVQSFATNLFLNSPKISYTALVPPSRVRPLIILGPDSQLLLKAPGDWHIIFKIFPENVI